MTRATSKPIRCRYVSLRRETPLERARFDASAQKDRADRKEHDLERERRLAIVMRCAHEAALAVLKDALLDSYLEFALQSEALAKARR